MVLVDTSIWVEHLRKGEASLRELLHRNLALTHPCVIGELACGAMVNRARVLADLAALPRATPATNEETLHLIQERRLWGRGIGWVDVQLLASALLSNCRLWTLDQRLDQAAREAGVRQFRPAPVHETRLS